MEAAGSKALDPQHRLVFYTMIPYAFRNKRGGKDEAAGLLL
jgi:hypothetical protein